MGGDTFWPLRRPRRGVLPLAHDRALARDRSSRRTRQLAERGARTPAARVGEGPRTGRARLPPRLLPPDPAPASAEASASSDSSPRIATARASASAGAPSRRSRCRTKRDDRLRAQLADVCGGARARLDPLGEDGCTSSLSRNGLPAQDGVHGLQELRRGIARESRSEESRDRIEAEWSRTHERCERLGLQLVEDRRVHAGLARPNGGRDDDRKPVESASDVRQESATRASRTSGGRRPRAA